MNTPEIQKNQKNKKFLAVAVLAGLTLGGLSVTAASAEGRDGDRTEPTTQDADGNETDVNASNVEIDDDGSIILVQDTDADETDEADADGEDGERRGHRGGCNLETAAEAIGIDEADLRSALEDGDTIADVAEANGVDVDTVIDAMVDAKADRIATKVEDGSITQEEADEKLANAESRIADRVNGVDNDNDDDDDDDGDNETDEA